MTVTRRSASGTKSLSDHTHAKVRLLPSFRFIETQSDGSASASLKKNEQYGTTTTTLLQIIRSEPMFRIDRKKRETKKPHTQRYKRLGSSTHKLFLVTGREREIGTKNESSGSCWAKWYSTHTHLWAEAKKKKKKSPVWRLWFCQTNM